MTCRIGIGCPYDLLGVFGWVPVKSRATKLVLLDFAVERRMCYSWEMT